MDITIGNKLNRKTKIRINENTPTRINFIVGVNSKSRKRIKAEKKKIDIAASEGVDTITDLSMVRLNQPLWKYVKEKYPKIGVGINPPYLPFAENSEKIKPDKLFKNIKKFIENGGDFTTMNLVPEKRREIEIAKDRLIPTTSRQGGILLKCMIEEEKDNPYFDIFEDIVSLYKKYNATINIGATFRPAGITEANDKAHLWEIEKQMEMFRKLKNEGVQSIVEIMSHQPLHQIGKKITNLRKKEGEFVPFQLLGPITTETMKDNDHISAAIGAAEAARYAAGKVTVIPSNEHRKFPSLRDVKNGLKATKIAVQSGDLTRIPSKLQEEKEILKHRRQKESCNEDSKKRGCNKCGVYCPLLLAKKISKFEE